MTFTIRPFAAHEWAAYKDLRLRALADAPDAFGSTLAREQALSDEEWANRLPSGSGMDWSLPLVAEIDGKPVGLAWVRIEPSTSDVANLYQMWVSPDYRGLGLGRMLLEAAITWATEKGAHSLELGVTLRDSPAMRLYTRVGFEPIGEPQPLRPGSELLAVPMRLRL
jgi:GNAT superfamily N-acetyltransferase